MRCSRLCTCSLFFVLVKAIDWRNVCVNAAQV